MLSAQAVTVTATYNSAADVPVTAAGYTATGNTVNFTLNYVPVVGTRLMVVKNTGLPFISGVFSNLTQGQAVPLSFGGTTYHFVANYYGGTGNDLVLEWAATRSFAWGSNSFGQLGDNTFIDRAAPVPVTAGVLAGKTVLSLAGGGLHVLALCADGTLAAWGSNVYGQLGDNTMSDSAVPVLVSTAGVLAGKTVISIAAGANHNLALCSDGTLAAWGFNVIGQLGDNTTTDRSAPVAVVTSGVLAGKTIVAIAAGNTHCLALCSDGALAAWGYNGEGELGDNTTTNRIVPVLVSTTGVLAGRTVVSIHGGGSHSLALCSDGAVAAWGYNAKGQLGDTTTAFRKVPVLVDATGVLAGKTVASLAAGASHSLALCTDGTLAAWGYNGFGQLGDGSTTDSAVPVLVNRAGVLSGKVGQGIAAGARHGVVLCTDGTVAAWGSNVSGELGNNSASDSALPVVVNGSALAVGERFARVSSGLANDTLAVVAVPVTAVAAPEVRVFTGANTLVGNERQSDIGNFTFINTAVGISSSPQTFTIQNSGGANLTGLALSKTGTNPGDFTVSAPGVTTLAPGATTTFTVTFSPTVVGSRSAVVRLASNDGDESSFGVNVTGTATASSGVSATFNAATDIPFTSSGYSAAGKTIAFTLNFAPTTGTELLVVKNTSLGFITGTFANLSQGQAVALTYNGIVYNFVANYYGGTGNDLVLVWAQSRLFAWGWNGYGQYGTGNTLTYALPVAVNHPSIAAGKSIFALAHGFASCVAVDSAGVLTSWGYNNHGQLGDNTTTQRNAPVAVVTSGVLSGKQVVSVAAGEYHMLGLCSDGTVVAWGNNAYGQLGDNTTTTRLVPVAVTNASGALAGKTVVAISAGRRHSLALCSDGTVAAWGDNAYGQLGDNSTTQRNIPVGTAGVLSGKTVVMVGGGYEHSGALCSDGTLATWGRNFNGQLGDNSTTNRLVPVGINGSGVLSGKTVLSYSVGGNLGLALCSDNTLAAWGTGSVGDNTTNQRNTPVAVVAGALAGKTVRSISVSGYSLMALCTDGTLAGWGYNAYGQVGDNTETNRLLPVAVMTTPLGVGERFARVFAGSLNSHTMALTAIGPAPEISVFEGQGTGGTERQSNVSNFNFPDTPVGTSSSAQTFTIKNIGSMTLTGLLVGVAGNQPDDFIPGSLGVGTLAPGAATTLSVTFSPLVVGTRTALLQISSNDSDEGTFVIPLTAHGVDNDNIVEALFNGPGDVPVTSNGYAAVGKAINFTLNFAPVTGTNLMVVRNTGANLIDGAFAGIVQGQVVALSYGGVTYPFVANYYGGSGNDLVLVWAGTRAFSWGWNAYGQLGDNTITPRSVPVSVTTTGPLFGKTILSLASGSQHSLALAADGTLAAWGWNGFGQLGDNTTAPRTTPVAVDVAGVLAGKRVFSMAGGYAHSLALCTDGTVAAWGGNFNGQLGDGTNTVRRTPVAVVTSGVLSGKKVVAVAAGIEHSLALCSDGTLAAWGSNADGQLGDGTNLDRAIPTAVSGAGVLAGRTVVAIAAGGYQSLALCSDGTLAAWGNNFFGQLGNNSTTVSKVPVQVDASGVLAGKTVVSISAGAYHVLALCSDGILAAWGRNEFGQLGDGTLLQRKTPVLVTTSGVLSGRPVISMVASQDDSRALCADGTLAGWGSNHDGQLGDGTTSQSNVPVVSGSLAGGNRFTGVFGGASSSHSLALVASPLPPAPEVTVFTGAGPVPGTERQSNAGAFDFSGVNLGSSSAVQTFTIRNAGTLPLTGITVTKGAGGNPGDFTVSSAGASSLAPNATTTFTATFTPSAAGTRVVAVQIASNDADENPFVVPLIGTGTGSNIVNAVYETATDVPLSVNGYNAAGKTISFTLNCSLVTGAELMVVRNTGLDFINGRFAGLAQGQAVAMSYNGTTYNFVANYYGGTGNDLVLAWANTKAYGWGANSALGINVTANYSPLPVPAITTGILAGKTVVSLSAGRWYTLALCSDSTLVTYGDGLNTPTAVSMTGALSGKTVVAIAAGDSHRVVLCSDGTVVTWGLNDYGQLGDGTLTNRPAPVAVNTSGVLAGKSVVAVAAGLIHTLVLCSDGTMAAWGHNASGELGDGNFTPNAPYGSSVPVAVTMSGFLAGKTVQAIAVNGFASMALCTDGTAAKWGGASAVPVSVDTTGVLAGKSFTGIAAGYWHSLVQCSDGTLATWGSNDYGQLGDNTTTNSTSPVLVMSSGVLAGKVPVSISAGSWQNHVLCSDGSVAAWGQNLHGALGDNTATQRNAPVAMNLTSLAPGERFVRIFGGSCTLHTVALVAAPPPPAPEISVFNGAGTALANERQNNTGSFVFSDGIVGTSGGAQIFTIKNTGTANLTGLVLSKTGANAGDFTLGSFGITTLALNATATFTVTFAPTALGARSASVQIASNDGNENPFVINLSGTGISQQQSWRQTYFGTSSNTGNAAASATPQNDGITNLVKFATAMDPTKPGTMPGTTSTSGGNLLFTYTRNKAAVNDGVMFVVEWNDVLNAVTWSNVGVSEGVADQGATETVTCIIPAGAAGKRFARLRVVGP